MLNILIVDDEIDIPFLFRHKFRKEISLENVHLHFCKGSQEALAFLSKHSDKNIDLILTDINMPGMSGLDLTKMVKSLYPEKLVFIITAYAESLNSEIGREYGADEFLTKPLEFAILKEKIANFFVNSVN